MTIIANAAKQKLAAGELAIGFGLRSMRTVDAGRIAAACGFDWLFIDMEHGSYDVDLACQISVAALDSGITPIPRVPGHQHFHASRVLDGGAMGVVVPHVSTVAEAKAAVDHCKFPPVGHRSMVGGLAQLGYGGGGSVANQAKIMNDNTLVVVMLETPEAIENADLPKRLWSRRLSSGGRAAAFSPDGSLVACTDRGGVATLWDAASGEQRAEFRVYGNRGHLAVMSGIAFHPTDPVLATATHDEIVRVWSVTSGLLLAEIPLAGLAQSHYYTGRLKDVQFHPSGDALAIAFEERVLWTDLRKFDKVIEGIGGSE